MVYEIQLDVAHQITGPQLPREWEDRGSDEVVGTGSGEEKRRTMGLNDFMNSGIKDIAETAARFYLKDNRGRSFMLRTSSALYKSVQIRSDHEKKGTHVPPFLIASIASECNLRCSGCYAWANGDCGDTTNSTQLRANEWRRIFGEASSLGVSFILLAGGEPLLRRDVIEAAAEFKNMIFPVFTNGTVIDKDYLDFFDEHRTIIPVLSIEGDDVQTDARRGAGVSEKVNEVAASLKERNLLYGTSITVTTENYLSVTEDSFVEDLREKGCGLIFYVEYVPAEEGTDHLILSDDDLSVLQQRVDSLRNDKRSRGTILLSFPGDEEAMGGCLAAGRGFFHINSTGGAEPCPFSPFSEINLREQRLIDVLHSDFFARVRDISAAEAINHKGGCTLFKHKDEVVQAVDPQAATHGAVEQSQVIEAEKTPRPQAVAS